MGTQFVRSVCMHSVCVHSVCVYVAWLSTYTWHVLTTCVVRQGKAFIFEGAAPHTLAEAAHAVLHVTSLRHAARYVRKCVST